MRKRVFLHIPKCGGSTVRDEIIKVFDKNRVIKVYGFDAPNRYMTKESFINEMEFGAGSFDAATGHFSLSDIKPFIRDLNLHVYTLIRDPIDREISDINYMKAKVNHRGHPWARQVNSQNLYNKLKGKPSGQAKILNIQSENDVCTLKEMVSSYKLESYKKMLLDFGCLEREEQEIQIKNITKDKTLTLEDSFVCRSMLTYAQILTLKEHFHLDYLLYKEAK